MCHFLALDHGQKIGKLDPWCGQIGKYLYLHILQQLDHTNYRRVDCDLFVEKNISLREALCGFTCTLYPLDGRNVGVSRSPGAVLSPGE